MSIALIATVAAALLAPLLHRIVGRWTGWVLAAVPAAWLVWLVSRANSIRDGEPLHDSIRWVPSLDIHLAFYVDGLGLLMASIVTGVGALILIYTGAYFGQKEPNIGRFYAFMFAFMAAMLGLVLADNVVTFFVFWELTSILSFFLIGFNHQSDRARASAQQALLITGGGGLALLGGLVILGVDSGHWTFSGMREAGYAGASDGLFTAALLLVVLGAFTKSAQFPFHGWLPNAMVAPTPVSAYLHSAAMVKAGIYLLARTHPTFASEDLWTALLVPAGGVTMILGGWLALRQDDMKLILAYTTVSALGTITLLLGLGDSTAAKAAVVFLASHALYKGALFMSAGAVDKVTGTRDVTVLRGLGRKVPLLSIAIVVAAVSMAGLPPVLGYYAKETLLAAAIHADASAIITTFAVLGGVLSFAAAALLTIKPLTGSPVPHPAPGRATVGLWLGPLLLAAAGLVFGVVPALGVDWFFEPAAAATYGASVVVELHLIPDETSVLLLSALTIGAGAMLSWLLLSHPGLRKTGSVPPLADLSFDASLYGLNWFSRGFTTLVQSGNLRLYLVTTMGVAIGLAGTVAVVQDAFVRPPSANDARFYEYALCGLILLGAIGAAGIGSRMGAVAALGVMGYGIALVYVFYGAPDLAMTQILVETLTVLLFVFVFLRLPTPRIRSSRSTFYRDAIIALAVGAFMTAVTWAVLAEDPPRKLAQFFGESAYPLAQGRNVVNTILVDFRALDTLGEIIVLAVAGFGVIALLRLRPHRSARE